MENKIKKILENEFNIKKMEVFVKEDPCCGGNAIKILLISEDFEKKLLV